MSTLTELLLGVKTTLKRRASKSELAWHELRESEMSILCAVASELMVAIRQRVMSGDLKRDRMVAL
jgi:hypothetical protein